MTLPVAVRAGQDFDGADRIDPHLCGFPEADAGTEAAHRFRRSDTAGFDVAGEADTAQLTFAFCLGLPRREAGIVNGLERGIERGIKVADVVRHDDGRLMREHRDEILAAKFGRIDLQLPRRGFHQTLNNKACLGSSGAAIGVNGGGVGVNTHHLGVDCRNVVLAR